MDKAELIITALKQRIGEIVSEYETQIAMLRAELTKMMQDQEEKDQAKEDYAQSLQEKIS
jgi:hypothetical protein